MNIDFQNGKYKSEAFPFQFFNNRAEWEEYLKEFPNVGEMAVVNIEERFRDSSTEVFEKAVEYIPRSLIGRKYQYWLAHRLIALLNEEGRGRVLDYGCGAGNMGIIFAYAGFNVDFVDVKGVIVDFLKWRIGKHFLQGQVLTHEDDLGEEKYDLVCMQNVLEHLDRPLEVLQKLNRSMVGGAYFLITFNTSGKGLDVVNWDTYNSILKPYLNSNFDIVENTDLMLLKKK